MRTFLFAILTLFLLASTADARRCRRCKSCYSSYRVKTVERYRGPVHVEPVAVVTKEVPVAPQDAETGHVKEQPEASAAPPHVHVQPHSHVYKKSSCKSSSCRKVRYRKRCRMCY